MHYNEPMGMYIISEIGTSHRGDLKRAERLIKASRKAGADAAKFQIVLAHEIIHPDTGIVPLPGGDISLYDHFVSLEQPLDFYRELQQLCKRYTIDFLATPFGEESARWLEMLKPSAFKVASPELNHLPLLEQLVSYNRPLILSTGVSKLKDIEEAVEYCKSVSITLLHCVTAYPAPVEDYNLSILPLYEKLFDCPVGVSDHSTDPFQVPLTALSQGAVMLEKHICLEKNNLGLDDPFALEPRAFGEMCRSIRQMEQYSKKEQQKMLEKRWGRDTLATLNGSGYKKLAPSEEANYGRTNRSLHALKTLEAGTTLSPENTALLRTEKVLKPGLAPRFYHQVMGKKLKYKVDSGQGIRLVDLLE